MHSKYLYLLKSSLFFLAVLFGQSVGQASVTDDIASAKAAWVAEDLEQSLSHLESALSLEPDHVEANVLAAIVKLAGLGEDPSLTALLESAGTSNYSADVFNLDIDVPYYREQSVIGSNADPWFYQTSSSSDGTDAAQSGAISDGELSAMEVSFSVAQAASFSFDYKVSSEAGYDFFRVYLDGQLIRERSGEQDWLTHYGWIENSGEHQLVFVYEKDGSVSEGSDAAWVDRLEVDTLGGSPSQMTLDDAIDFSHPDGGALSIEGESVPILQQTDVPSLTPTFSTQDILDWINASAVPCLLEIEAHLEKANPVGFVIELPATESFSEPVEIDYYDALMLRALVNGVLATTGILNEHNIEVFIDALVQRERPISEQMSGSGSLDAEWLFETYPSLLALRPNADFSEVEGRIRDLRNLYVSASDGIFARSAETRRLFNAGSQHPAADTAWFAQTVITHDGFDAVQSGNIKQWGLYESKMSILVEGPGTLSYWWRLSNYNAIDSAQHGVTLYRSDAGSKNYLEGIWGEQAMWEQVSVSIPSGSHTIEWIYQFDDNRLSSADAAFVDQVVFTPDGGSPVTLLPSANALDQALDASLNATSENSQVDSIGISWSTDVEVRDFLNDLIASFDGVIVSDIGNLTLRPYLDGQVDPSQLLPEFRNDQMVRFSFPDPTFSGMLPNFDASQLDDELQWHAPELLAEPDSEPPLLNTVTLELYRSTDLNNWTKHSVTSEMLDEQGRIILSGVPSGEFYRLQLEVQAGPDPVQQGMVLVEGGTFTMGDSVGDGDSDERPTHEVTLSSFYIGQYEVTNSEVASVFNWALDEGLITVSSSTVRNAQGNEQELLDLNGYDSQISYNGTDLVVDVGKEDHPCIQVTWYGAMAYANYRSDLENLTRAVDFSDWSVDYSVDGYRLPTEAEWEYAARGGTESEDYTYSGSNDLNAVGWYSSNSGSRTHSVDGKAANELGLYDMSGNVWEWCSDRYGSYSAAAVTDPRGPAPGSINRVLRGGGWGSTARHCRVPSRSGSLPWDSSNSIGFRLSKGQ